jgi:Ser/Thr protein kinase RdoA (MazF antagonist)
MPETERNRLLRRLDWRFLLRQEDEPRTLCLARGLLAEAASTVWAEPPPGAPADLVIVADPSPIELAEAVSRLRPGGELYAEWSRPRPGGCRTLTRLLEHVGLAEVRCYWAWPRPDRGAQFWLPVDAGEALGFFLRPRRRGLRGRLRVRLWLAAARLGILAPLSTVARRPAEEPADDGTSWLLLTGGRRSTNKVVGLRVTAGAHVPEAVVKFARSAAEEESLRREQRVLEELARARADLRGVPKPLSVTKRCDRFALAETVLPGRPLQECLRRETHMELATRVTDWLVELASEGETRRREDWWERLVGEPLAFLARSFGDAVQAEELDTARSLLQPLPDLPLVCEQRDCAPWNILVDDGLAVSVLDWESAEPRGLPALDLVYFLTYAALLVDRALATGRVREAYAASLDPATRTGRVVRACESSYCERLGLDFALLPPLRLLCWAVHARSDYAQLTGDAAGPPIRDALGLSFFLTLWREELRRQSP